MNKIKMLWVTNTIGYGGAERQVLIMGHALHELNYSIDVLYYDDKGSEFLPHFENSSINLIYIDKSKCGNIKFIKKVTELIKKNNYDIVHAFGGGTANIYGRLPALIARTPVVIGAMLGKKHFTYTKMKWVNSVINIFTKNWTINNTDLEPILKKDLHFLRKQKIWLIHNGFDDHNKVDYQINKQTYYDSLKKHKFVVTAIGRITPVKNQKMFLEAAKEILKTNDNVEFWLVGKGELVKSFNEWIENEGLDHKVKLLGYRDDIDIALSRSDIFVQTSNTEGSPNTIAEALRAKRPVVSTRSTSMNEFIVEGVNGYVTDVGNKDQLVDRINILLNKGKSELHEMGEKSLEMFNHSFLIDHVLKEFDDMYKHLLKLKSKGVVHEQYIKNN
ncbi:glycosyltransferase [Chengkuizengella sp. SCS-71B]|uniref:glycosyltransferase n=1 Tax=Chengkuizengella sp. SCS-71B TaxID=3115290 RepID=UPI0032C24A48